MKDDLQGAILQRDKETYAIVPRTPVGIVTAEVLEKLAAVIRKYDIPITKITSGQRFALVGIQENEIEQIWKELGLDIGRATELCLHYVQACPGTAVCRFGVQDSLGLGSELEKDFLGVDFPAKIKIGVSGCPMCCAESLLRDVGIFGKKKGWTVTFGGNAGRRPRIADVVGEDLSKDEAVKLVNKCLDYYNDNARKKERTSRFMNRTGFEALQEYLAQ